MATVADVAKHLDLSMVRVSHFQKVGVLPRAAAGLLDLDQCRVAYIRYLRAGASNRGIPGGERGILDLTAERARLAKEQADHHRMKNDQLRGELLPRDEVIAFVQVMFSNTKARLLTIPTKAAPAMLRLRSLPVIKAKLTELIHETLGDLSVEKFTASRGQLDGAADGGSMDHRSGNGMLKGTNATTDAQD